MKLSGWVVRSIMGVTVAYRGRIADLSRIEDFEDRSIDLSLSSSRARSYLAQLIRHRSGPDHPRRHPRSRAGLEPTSLLLSPWGWLIGLTDIEDAEEGRLTEPPWCFTKTQFGPVEAHVALVELFTALSASSSPISRSSMTVVTGRRVTLVHWSRISRPHGRDRRTRGRAPALRTQS